MKNWCVEYILELYFMIHLIRIPSIGFFTILSITSTHTRREFLSISAKNRLLLVSGWIARHPQDALADDLHSAILLTSTRPTEGHSESYVCGDDVRPGGYELVRHRKNPHCGTFTAITKPFPRAIVLEAETRKVTTWESPSFPSLDGSAS